MYGDLGKGYEIRELDLGIVELGQVGGFEGEDMVVVVGFVELIKRLGGLKMMAVENGWVVEVGE
nr:hypothetical protein [Neisseria sicca]